MTGYCWPKAVHSGEAQKTTISGTFFAARVFYCQGKLALNSPNVYVEREHFANCKIGAGDFKIAFIV